MNTKVCSRCGITKPIGQFYKRNDSINGRRGVCSECRNKNNICGIYCIENMSNKRKYIGYSVNIKRRFSAHIGDLRRNRHANQFLQNSYNKNGEENFKFYVIEECPKSELFVREQFYIKFFSSKIPFGYNLTDGGSGSLNPSEDSRLKMSIAGCGRIFTEEHKKNLSKNHADFSGENAPMLGKHHSEESRLKSSLAKMGCKNPMYGKHFSESSRIKLSLSLSGSKNPKFKDKETVLKIKEMIDSGFTCKDIMAFLHVGRRVVINVKDGYYKDAYDV